MNTFPTTFFSGKRAAAASLSISLVASASQYLSMSAANWGYSNINRSKFSVNFWFKRATVPGTGMYLFQIHDSTADAFDIILDSTNNLRVRCSSNNSTFEGEYITNAAYTDNNWHQCLAWLDVANATATQRMRLWVDGAEPSLGTQTTPSAAISASPAGPVCWGSNSGASFFSGNIYQPAFFNGVLTDINSVYNAGSPLSVSSLPGLFSLLNTNSSDAVTKDFIISTAWTNNGTLQKSADIPV